MSNGESKIVRAKRDKDSGFEDLYQKCLGLGMSPERAEKTARDFSSGKIIEGMALGGLWVDDLSRIFEKVLFEQNAKKTVVEIGREDDESHHIVVKFIKIHKD